MSWRGPALVAIALLHTAFTAAVASGLGLTPELLAHAGGSAPLTRIVPGMGLVQPPDLGALAFFWSLCFGVALLLVGLLVLEVERGGGRVSALVAGLLLALALAGAAIVPAGGFWLALPVAGSLLYRARAR